MVKRLTGLVIAMTLVAAASAQAEYRHLEIKTLGMD
jgi:hypothetical protein